MYRTNEADLVAATLLYALRCISEGKRDALRKMQIGDKEVEEIKQLSAEDLTRLDSLAAHCLNIELNKAAFWSVINHVKMCRKSDHTMQELLKADAPLAMMTHFYGLYANDYSRLRKSLCDTSGVGRPPEISEEDSHRLWYAYTELMQNRTTLEITAEEYLSLHQKTNVPMRAIWRLTQRWLDYGNTSSKEN